MFKFNIDIYLLIWTCILIYLIYYIKNSYIRFNRNRKYIIYMVIISSVHVLIYFYIGFILGFLKSPYNHDILTLIQNILTKTIPIIAIEIARSIIATKNKNNKKILIILTITLILIETNYNILNNIIQDKKELYQYICSTILPNITCNILYTYLTLKGSYTLVLVYRLFKELISILMPILPDLNWFISGSVGIISPTIVYILFKYKFIVETKYIKTKKENTLDKISYAITLILLINLVLFVLGVYKFEPITILSNSMEPTYSRGDVVIYEKLNEKELKEIPENSIIIYSMENKNIAHRITEKIKNKDKILYQTKGDSNNATDKNLVKIEQIKGIYKFHIKYIGYPSVWLYELFNKKQ